MRPERELTLDEMLSDPIVRLVMSRDGVEDDQVRKLFGHLRPRNRAAVSSPQNVSRDAAAKPGTSGLDLDRPLSSRHPQSRSR
jgi:hypothetical protein